MERLLSKKQTRDRVGISPTQMTRLEAVGRFPLRVTQDYRVFYRESEIETYILGLIAKRDARPPVKRRDDELGE